MESQVTIKKKNPPPTNLHNDVKIVSDISSRKKMKYGVYNILSFL